MNAIGRMYVFDSRIDIHALPTTKIKSRKVRTFSIQFLLMLLIAMLMQHNTTHLLLCKSNRYKVA